MRAALGDVLRNSSWLMGERIVRLICGLLIGVWVARYLGPESYGVLNFAISFCSLIAIFATLGLNRAVVRELAEGSADPLAQARIVVSVVLLRLIAAVACAFAAYALNVLFQQTQPILVGILCFTIVFAAFDTVDLYFTAEMRSSVSVVVRSAAFFFFLGAKILLISYGAELEFFAWATTLEAAVSALGLWVAFRRCGPSVANLPLDLNHALTLVRQSWPEIFAGFASVVFMRIDQIMLGNMIGPQAVGVYSVASRLAEAWYFVPSALVSSSFPSIVRLRSAEKSEYLRALHHLTLTLVVLAYGAIAITQLIGHWVVVRLYGISYAEAGEVLVILIWSGLFVSLGLSSGSYIMAERQPMLNLRRNIFGALANIGLNFWLIPIWGAKGAAVGTLASLAIAFLLSDFFSSVMRPLGWIKLKSLFLIWR